MTTERLRIDRLISFYELYRPSMGQEIDVRLTPRELCRLFDVPAKASSDGRSKIWPAEIAYRGRVLHALKR